MSHATVTSSTCPNCGRTLAGPFCAECGQKAAPLNPTFHDLVHDLTHEFLHVDAKIFQSVRLLLTRPGFLSREHFDGRRARYVSPIRLYLIFSVVYFALAALAPASHANVSGSEAGDVEELRQLGFESEAELQEAVNDALTHWVPRLMFVLVPLFALLVSRASRRSGRNYPQHLYFALHVHAASFALLAIGALVGYASSSGPFAGAVQTVVVAAIFVYFVLALRTAYGTTAAQAVRRAAVVAILYAVAVGAAVAGIIIPFVLPALLRRAS